MTFGEKVRKLRKEDGLSQEALAEELDTTRQAVSKWENDQGYPDTEKLLTIATYFGVSIDYLLKQSYGTSAPEAETYYVSDEMAEGYVDQMTKMARPFSWSAVLIASAFVPYLLFTRPAVYAFLIVLLGSAGLLTFIYAVSKESKKYDFLTTKPLTFDHTYLSQLTEQYEQIKKRFSIWIGVGITFIIIGVLSFALEENGITQGYLTAYYPVFVLLIGIGAAALFRTLPVLAAYQLLVHNEQHIQALQARSEKKWRKLWKEWF
ncbi:helix-turn-helix domain-containing protein [Halobacillus sp. ACCC02827]|uniref:helix-turn-helix domain-containing protein n=1 Tax=Halobacillus sp. ACCC02827 TaxID=3052090 RepID=UPI002570EAF2|nr:helix-turn-helix domain-containing protein [Halobacillus sp. ACCC02827]WJE16914.1 helix-turn-helix domain-containing protein [Halobacillus sp. ACCC02827]